MANQAKLVAFLAQKIFVLRFMGIVAGRAFTILNRLVFDPGLGQKIVVAGKANGVLSPLQTLRIF
jgi:hypothetical protein